MIKRFAKALLFVVLLCMLPIEIVFYSLRWVATGEGFPDLPICFKIVLE